MRRALSYLAAGLLVVMPLGAVAQDQSEQDRGFLTEFLEENLSGAGRDVRVTGFEGALSSLATIDEMTFADDEGIWLTIRDATIAWNRSALLRGRVELGELTAREIEVARLPVAADTGLPEAEATPFQLPELPVAVEIGEISAEALILRSPLLGEDITMSLAGSLQLAGGEGEATLSVERTDEKDGALTLDAAFANETEFLTINLALQEPQGGIAAGLLGLPGQPAIGLSVEGEGPLSDFDAEVALTSDDEPRLTGRITLREDQVEATDPDTPPPPATQRFTLDLGGDISPLFLPQYREFFGNEMRIVAAGQRVPGGQTELSELRIEAAALQLEGNLTLAADGLPEAFALSGQIAAPDGQPVRLPTGEPSVFVDSAGLEFSFDATRGDEWAGTAEIARLQAGDNSLGQAILRASGQIGRGAEGQSFGARLTLEATDVTLADPALAQAAGTRLDAQANILWRAGQPVNLSNVVVQTETARAAFNGTIGSVPDGLPLTMQGSANLSDLAVFSALANQPLEGRIILAINGQTNVLDGRFDIRASGVGRNLAVGIDPVDRIVAGESKLVLDARRDETGITLRQFDVTTSEAQITAVGLVRSGATNLTATARVDEAGRVFPGLSGPAELRAEIEETTRGTYDISTTGEGPGGASVNFNGALVDGADGLTADGRLIAEVADLGAYATLADRRLRGALSLEVTGEAALTENLFDVSAELTSQNLALGEPSLDQLLRGTATLTASARREGDETTIRRFQLSSPEVTADISGTLGRRDGQIEGTARLRNLGLFAPDFPGALDVQGTLSRGSDRRWGVDIRATGPGNTTATITGSAAETGETVDLTIRGEGPLGIANAAIAPRAIRGRAVFDLAMRGAPGLPALSGRVTTNGARLVAPNYGLALENIDGTVTLANARADIQIDSAVDGGGRVRVGGSVGLEAPNQASLRIALERARITDPELFETDVSGEITISGPLQGGGLIGGVLTLGTTEVRLAATGTGAGGELPGLRHVNEPADVRRTRLWAGFTEGAGGGGGGGNGALQLDLLIRAPNQIFIRGRGLDAELGGSIRLRGTTADVIPQGQFTLIRGRLDILGRRLALDEGLARLEGSFDPFIRLVATTEAEEITVRVVVEGFASEPEIRFESSPELPEDEVLARLFFGKDISELSPLQAARLVSAVATLSGRGGGGIVENLRENFGLDDLDVTTDEDGNAAVRAGAYLSENVYTDVTVGADGQADITINLDVSRSVTVKGSVGSDGETGLGIFYERDY